MTQGKFRMILGMALSLAILGVGAEIALAKEAPRISKEELKSMLGNPDLIIIDVRTDSDWEKSQSKIQGALREDPEQATKSWAEKYAKDKTMVLYCA